MSNNNIAKHDPFWDQLGVSEKTQEQLKIAIGKGVEFVGYVSGFASAVNTAEWLLEAVGFIEPKKSEFEKYYEKLAAALDEIKDKINALSKQILQVEVDDKTGDVDFVVTALISYQALIYEVGYPPPPDRQAATELKSESAAAAKAASDLQKAGFWLRTYNEKDLCQLLWGQKNYRPPYENGSYIWDYRITLPALLYAIFARTVVLKLLERNFKTISHDEIDGYAKYLHENVYEKIRNGIVRTPAPPLKEVIDKKITGEAELSVSNGNYWWEWQEKRCGAVEIYSGSAQVEVLPFEQPIRILYFEELGAYKYAIRNFRDGRTYPGPEYQEKLRRNFETQRLAGIEANKRLKPYHEWFYLVFAIRAERAWQKMFETSVLPQLWQTIFKLKQLVGEPFPEFPPERGFSLKAVLESPVKISFEPYVNREEPLALNIGSPVSLRRLAQILGKELSSKPKLFGYSSSVSLRTILAGS